MSVGEQPPTMLWNCLPEIHGIHLAGAGFHERCFVAKITIMAHYFLLGNLEQGRS